MSENSRYNKSNPSTEGIIDRVIGVAKGLLREWVFIDTTPGKLREYQDRLTRPMASTTPAGRLAATMGLLQGWSEARARRHGQNRRLPEISPITDRLGRTTGATASEHYTIQSTSRYKPLQNPAATTYEVQSIGRSPFLKDGQIDDIKIGRKSMVGADGDPSSDSRSDVLSISMTSRSPHHTGVDKFTLQAVSDSEFAVTHEWLSQGSFTQEPTWVKSTGEPAVASLNQALGALNSIEGLTLGALAAR